VHPHELRLAFGAPFPSGVLEIADQLLLLAVDRDDRLASLQRLSTGPVDPPELQIAIRMLASLSGLGVRLEAVARRPQQLGDRDVLNLMSLLTQRPCEMANTLGRPYNNDSGSPRRPPSTNASKATNTSGSASVNRLRPPPASRTRPAPIDSPASSSAIPFRIVSTAIPVARAVPAIPPRPAALASEAAHNRRWRSFNSASQRTELLPDRDLVNHTPRFEARTPQPADLFMNEP